MNLSPILEKTYTKEHLSAREAQARAEWIAWGPIVFQASRLMLKFGILDMLRDSDQGMTIAEVAEKTGLSVYAVKVLMEASLCIGTVIVDKDSERFELSKTGWFLINDPATRVNLDFNHDVNYEGWFHLEEALREGKPAGLRHFGDWPTIYEGLSSLPEQVQKSWFAFDHFYSDSSFQQALEVVFGYKPKTLLDVGGNTGRWALQCVGYDKDVCVTVMDLPQQVEMMRRQTAGKPGAERIDAYPTDLLNRNNPFPTNKHYDAIWMSQFLDCFGEDEIQSILERAAKIMDSESRVYIMETLWDRQRFEPAAFCLTMTSLYFTAMANGNSKMYNSDDLVRLIRQAGLEVETIHDHLGQGHSIIVCKVKEDKN
ncbi:MAG: methyltransferase domain-containing protein [Prevotella sp.]|nr:methyltransferase domain-containing protein [Prevotella sp.]